MYAEFAAECAEDDPVLLVPWAAEPEETGPTLGRRFVDLRADPWAFEEIPEAERHPALLEALRALNAPRSPVFTAKCDAWKLDGEERESLALDLPLSTAEHGFGFGSYVDLVWRDRAVFTSAHQTAQLCQRLIRLAEPLELPGAALRLIQRPALVDFDGPREGFAVSLYTSALAASEGEAYRLWAESLRVVATLLRGREFRPALRTESQRSGSGRYNEAEARNDASGE